MGHTMSPVCCQILLEYKWQKTFGTKEEKRALGLPCWNYFILQVLCANLHVDDCLWISQLLCCLCIFRCVRAIWTNLDVQEEGSNPSVVFLHTEVSYSELDASHGYLHIRPHNKNVDFCMGRSEWPEVSRLALFADSSLQSVKQLQQFVWPHAVLGHYIAIYAKFDNKESIIQLACECLLLLWPVRWVSTALRSVPPYMCSRHIWMSRWIGKLMVANFDQLQCARTDYINAGFKYPRFRDVLLQITQ